MPRRLALPVISASLALLAGCAYSGDDIGNPIYRKAQWYSFVEGSDIAGACAAGAPERFRLVYNGLWDQQVRVYEWDSPAKTLKITTIRSGNVATMDLWDPLSPWRADSATVSLDQVAYAGLADALDRSGAFGPPAVGLQLPSHSYYWTAASCRQGKYSFTAWAYPSSAYDAARFPAALAALDPGREAIVTPGPVPVDPFREYDLKRGAVAEFTLKVGPSGLASW
ncbi:hypothetical protein CCC_03869 [Paramagnetospirillum magnetotacticum MS-1]|uniref:Lipoprotein n=1 Tax=Paramagnetospirillum magnetotacticum MS-1 TaxID=272627 RepID=A0A0C2UDX4_PARME|nr:hypothetical protein [Paramagnetospirillum magnetotacticum]KIL99697.1 hypothetical protein CCC_03869 [Paramagnetospirillum magnetotacticum MS-1]